MKRSQEPSREQQKAQKKRKFALIGEEWGAVKGAEKTSLNCLLEDIRSKQMEELKNLEPEITRGGAEGVEKIDKNSTQNNLSLDCMTENRSSGNLKGGVEILENLSNLEPDNTGQLGRSILTVDDPTSCQEESCQEEVGQGISLDTEIKGGVKNDTLETPVTIEVVNNEGVVINENVVNKNDNQIMEGDYSGVRSELMVTEKCDLVKHLKPDNDCVVRKKICVVHNRPAVKETKNIRAWTRLKDGLYGYRTRKISRWKCDYSLVHQPVS